jgi:beta-galactoside alpha-2,3-sialyltransferase (sialyltransferase 4A)
MLMCVLVVSCSAEIEPDPRDVPEPEMNPYHELETTTERPLQQRLQAAFPESYEDGVQIFWEPDDGWIDDDLVMFWRSRIYPEDIDGVNQSASEKMFSKISGQAPVFSNDATRRICAVVGASGNLLGSRYGRLIDAHNVVFRVNRAPIDVFEHDVGSKSTHHVTWPRDLDQHQFDASAFLLMTPISTNMPDVFDRILYLVEDVYRSDPQLVRIIHPEFIRYVHENWTESRLQYPSTGFIELMIALHVCDEVNVFGFGANAQGLWDRYYDNDPQLPSGFHPGDFEGDLRREMETRGILKVFRGSRSESGAYPGMAGRE